MFRRAGFTSINTEQRANIFAALGDPTRLTLVDKLIDGKLHSISSLTTDTKLTRQAITKHLNVLGNVGIVSNIKAGRESLYALDPKPMKSIQEYLAIIAAQWDNTLQDLKAFVEE
ncbi:MAG: ArsR/SmtB family transcription factor [Methylophilus sp.]